MRLTALVEELSEELRIPKVHLYRIIRVLEDKMRERLLFGEDINIREVGTFTRTIRNERMCYNMVAKKLYKAPKTYALLFKPSRRLKKALMKKTVY